MDQKKSNGNLYWGSGIRIQNQIKKYGKKNFKYTVLVIAELDYIFDLEKRMVTQELIESDNKCLNLTSGGLGVGFVSEQTREILRQKNTGRKLTEEQSRKHSESLKRAHADGVWAKKISNTLTGIVRSEETKKKMSDAAKLRPHTWATREQLKTWRANQVFPEGHYERLGKIISQLVWINNGKENKRVGPDVLQERLLNGWSKGKINKSNNLGE